MRDRLIELILNTPVLKFPSGSREQGKTYQTAQNVADHLLANGVIVPPCKVGDTVYEINRYDFESCKRCGKNGDVCPYLYSEVGYGYECLNTKYGEKLLECSKIEVIKIQDISYIFHRWFDFGKTVFLTKEEAEKSLAEMINTEEEE